MTEPTPSQQAASAAATPKTTPLERVARAIADNITPELHDQIAFGYCAQAALQALRQVDDETVEAMVDAAPGWPWDWDAERAERAEVVKCAFTAGLDHILGEKP